MNSKEAVKFLWISLGALFLFIMSPYFDGKWGFHLLRHFNVLQFILAMILQPLSCFVLSGLFVIFSVQIHKRKWGIVFISFVFILEVLNALWFHKAWSYGFRYQGEHFTIMIAWVNLLCFGLVLLLTGLGVKYKKQLFLHIATLTFFITLAFIAFPWLGESI